MNNSGRLRQSLATRCAAAGITLLAALALAACTPDADPTSSPTQTQSADPQASGAGGTRTVPPGFIECDGRPPKDGELVADVDLTTLRSSVPSGFSESFSYAEDNPVEGDWEGTYYTPDNAQDFLDVINLVVDIGAALNPDFTNCQRS